MTYEVITKKDNTVSFCDDAVNLLPVEITSNPYWKKFRYKPIPTAGSSFETQRFKVIIL